MVRARGVERPDVEVFNAALAIDEVQGRALAEGHADEAFLQYPVPEFSGEEVLPVQARDLGQTTQIFERDPLVGTASPPTPSETITGAVDLPSPPNG